MTELSENNTVDRFLRQIVQTTFGMLCGLISVCGPFAPIADAKDIDVATPEQLRSALQELNPGTRIRIAAGEYTGSWYVSDVADLTIEPADPKNPPMFRGGNGSWHFSGCSGLILRGIVVVGCRHNGINIDDGGKEGQSTRDITIEGVVVREIGPTGNVDAIKCSGLDHLTIKDCQLEGWGGQGIDMVGCHQVLVSGCQFTGRKGFTASAGVQMKGGSSDIVVEKCRFLNGGERPLNVGGSTAAQFFRPRDAKSEASNITVRDNTIEGSLCAVAFVGVDGAEFTGNTILFPEKWIFRILQETATDGFIQCRNVTVRDNRIVFRRSQVQTEVNVGSNTQPETFRFENNHWFAEDRPAASKPHLPVSETNGHYGTDPRIDVAE
jgi:hypothetical protein